MTLRIRPAVPGDVPALRALIEASARALSAGFYTPHQIESALLHVFGVDSQLIADGTYFAAVDGGTIVGCGGWSLRKTLYGGDQSGRRSEQRLDPARDPARIRAFFIAPDRARRGVGRGLLDACEQAAREAGFRRLELMATLPGVPFYAACGYEAIERVADTLPDGTTLDFVRMTRELDPPAAGT